MKNVYRTKFLLILLTMTLVDGCGTNHHPKTPDFVIKSEMKATQDIATEELSIAQRICYAYKSKSAKLKSEYNLKTFVWKLKNQNCDKSENTQSIQATVKSDFGSGTLAFEMPTGITAKGFLSNVQTDTNGFLSSVCEKISRGNTISNTTELNGIKVQLSFDRKDLDRYKIDYFSINKENKYVIYATDVISVRTQFTWKDGQLLGGDELVTRYNQCGTSDSYSIDTQTFEKIL